MPTGKKTEFQTLCPISDPQIHLCCENCLKMRQIFVSMLLAALLLLCCESRARTHLRKVCFTFHLISLIFHPYLLRLLFFQNDASADFPAPAPGLLFFLVLFNFHEFVFSSVQSWIVILMTRPPKMGSKTRDKNRKNKDWQKKKKNQLKRKQKHPTSQFEEEELALILMIMKEDG